jgi:hypothetical protein
MKIFLTRVDKDNAKLTLSIFFCTPPYTRKKSAADPTLFYLFIYFDRGDV